MRVVLQIVGTSRETNGRRVVHLLYFYFVWFVACGSMRIFSILFVPILQDSHRQHLKVAICFFMVSVVFIGVLRCFGWVFEETLGCWVLDFWVFECRGMIFCGFCCVCRCFNVFWMSFLRNPGCLNFEFSVNWRLPAVFVRSLMSKNLFLSDLEDVGETLGFWFLGAVWMWGLVLLLGSCLVFVFSCSVFVGVLVSFFRKRCSASWWY